MYFIPVNKVIEILDLYMLDEVNIIDAQSWFAKKKPPMNLEILSKLELLVILRGKIIEMFLSIKKVMSSKGKGR